MGRSPDTGFSKKAGKNLNLKWATFAYTSLETKITMGKNGNKELAK
jgi:hypothetical protein